MGVLLVEDHQELAETVSGVLRGEGITADVARDGQAALDRSTVNGYDVIVLDRDLPGVHGDKVCRALVAGRSQSRVLTLTAAGSIEDRGGGLEARLGDTSEGLKARGMTFRQMMLSHIVTGRFEHPNSTAPAVRQDPVRSRPWRGCAGGEHSDGPGRRMGCPRHAQPVSDTQSAAPAEQARPSSQAA